MSRILVLFLLCILVYRSAARPGETTRKLDSIFSYMHAQHQFNGSALIAEKGTVVFKRGYGLSNEATRSPNNPATIFEPASCSKQFTAAAIRLLRRQGKLRYDDSLGSFFPSYAPGAGLRCGICSGIPAAFPNTSATWAKTAATPPPIRT